MTATPTDRSFQTQRTAVLRRMSGAMLPRRVLIAVAWLAACAAAVYGVAGGRWGRARATTSEPRSPGR